MALNYKRAGFTPLVSLSGRASHEKDYGRDWENQFVSGKQKCTFFEESLFLRNKIDFWKVKNEKTSMGKGDYQAVEASF